MAVGLDSARLMAAGDAVEVARIGDQRIDGILAGIRWSGSVSYSDPDAAEDYPQGYFTDHDKDGVSAQFQGFSQLGADQFAAVHRALNADAALAAAAGFAVEGLTDAILDAAAAGTGAGMIRLANTSDADDETAGAYANYPSDNEAGGDVFFDTSGRAPRPGNSTTRRSCMRSATRWD